MTVVFVDPSGKTLDSLNESLEFTASDEVVAISVGFGSVRAEERVYRDGVFLHPYLRSTRNGTAYSIVRDGDEWPAHPQLYVDEATPAPTSFWTSLYSVDFAALPNQTVNASGTGVRTTSPTIDGKTWRSYTNSFNGATPSSTAIVNASGLVINAGGVSAVCSGGAVACPHVSLDMDQLPAWNAAYDTIVMARITGAAFSGSGDGLGVLAHDFGTSGSARVFGRFRTSSVGVWGKTAGEGTLSEADTEYATAGSLDFVVALVYRANKSASGFFLPWTGSMPAPEDLLATAYIAAHVSYNVAANSFGVMATSRFGASYTATIKSMQILQRSP